MSSLRVALLQLVSHGRNVEANRDKGEEYCRQAAADGADVALFPEMWSIGYARFDDAVAGDRDAWLNLAVTRSEPFVEHFRRLARALGIAIGLTYLERTSGAPRNALTLFDGDGREVLNYAKVHLCPWDPPDNVCASGDDFPVATLATRGGEVRVGAMICFDREFPEAARMLMLDGAELILTPNACDLDDRKSGVGDVRIAQFRARAFENLVAVAMANYAAPQQDGHSVAFYPDGATIVAAGTEEGVVMADIDLNRLREWRRREARRDGPRCPEKYRAVTSTKRRPL